MISFRDYHGNAVHDFGVAYLHDRLVIESTSDVVTHAGADEPLAGPAEGEPDASPALSEVTGDPVPRGRARRVSRAERLRSRSPTRRPEIARRAPRRATLTRARSPSSDAPPTTSASGSTTSSARRRWRAPSPRCSPAAPVSARTSPTSSSRSAATSGYRLATSVATSAASRLRAPRTRGSRRTSLRTGGSVSTRPWARRARVEHVKLGIGPRLRGRRGAPRHLPRRRPSAELEVEVTSGVARRARRRGTGLQRRTSRSRGSSRSRTSAPCGSTSAAP